jgi:hypothetical protein
MSNESLLRIWFPLSWVFVIALGLIVIRLLRGSVNDLASRMGKPFRQFVNVAFPAGIMLPVLAAFLSVSYFQNGCNRYEDYNDVMRSPYQLIYVAQHEMLSMLLTAVIVILFWAGIYTLLLLVWKKSVDLHQ